MGNFHVSVHIDFNDFLALTVDISIVPEAGLATRLPSDQHKPSDQKCSWQLFQ